VLGQSGAMPRKAGPIVRIFSRCISRIGRVGMGNGRQGLRFDPIGTRRAPRWLRWPRHFGLTWPPVADRIARAPRHHSLSLRACSSGPGLPARDYGAGRQARHRDKSPVGRSRRRQGEVWRFAGPRAYAFPGSVSVSIPIAPPCSRCSGGLPASQCATQDRGQRRPDRLAQPGLPVRPDSLARVRCGPVVGGIGAVKAQCHGCAVFLDT
jgi:hypothetical protein